MPPRQHLKLGAYETRIGGLDRAIRVEALLLSQSYLWAIITLAAQCSPPNAFSNSGHNKLAIEPKKNNKKKTTASRSISWSSLNGECVLHKRTPLFVCCFTTW